MWWFGLAASWFEMPTVQSTQLNPVRSQISSLGETLFTLSNGNNYDNNVTLMESDKPSNLIHQLVQYIEAKKQK